MSADEFRRLKQTVQVMRLAGGATGSEVTRQVCQAAEALVDAVTAAPGLHLAPAAARQGGPITSAQAAGSITPAGQRHTAIAVLAMLRQHGPMTDQALVDRLPGHSPSGVRSRRHELVALGLVADTGLLAETSSGRMAKVWKACSVQEWATHLARSGS